MENTFFFSHKPKFYFLVVIAMLVVIAFSPMLDIFISGLFYKNGHFVLESNPLFNLIDKGLPEPLVGFSLLVFVLWLIGFMNSKKWIMKINTDVMLFLFGSMVMGPMLIVNGLFKSIWGRARPMEIVEFGGDKVFSPAMVMSNQCSWDCSFVSGHTAIGFWLVAPALMFPRKYRKLAVCCAFLIGAMFGLARIAQGYHFFSDVFFSALITIYVVWFLYYRIFVEKRAA